MALTKLKTTTKTPSSTSTQALVFLIVGVSAVTLGISIFALAFIGASMNKPVFKIATWSQSNTNEGNAETNTISNTNTNTSQVCVETSGVIQRTASMNVNDCHEVANETVDNLCTQAYQQVADELAKVKCNPGCIKKSDSWTEVYRCGFYISPVANNNSLICWIVWIETTPASQLWDLCRYAANEVGIADTHTASCKATRPWQCVSP